MKAVKAIFIGGIIAASVYFVSGCTTVADYDICDTENCGSPNVEVEVK